MSRQWRGRKRPWPSRCAGLRARALALPYETADVLKGPKPRNNESRSKIGQKEVRGLTGKIGQKYRKTCIFDLFLTYFARKPPDLLLTYF